MKIVLFDMDGTLTEPRQKMQADIARALGKLQKSGYRIGIVTGSEMHYVLEQCEIMFDFTPVNYRDIDYFPCNGTKHYVYDENGKIKQLHNISMQDHIGQSKYNDLVFKLIENQLRVKLALFKDKIPLTGNFVDCRGSMINWCPIGRNANNDQRKVWVALDKKHNIRQSFLDMYFKDPIYENISVRLGGSTSFDIFPAGWDKTYVMRHLSKYTHVYFVGDKCEQGGNDKDLYDLLIKTGQAYKTESPEKTIKIIDSINKGNKNETR